MSTAKRRSAHARVILGPELYAQLANTNVLLVGAGGIGCELRKWAGGYSMIFAHVFVLLLAVLVVSEKRRSDWFWQNHASRFGHH